jgi:hypothetical protein
MSRKVYFQDTSISFDGTPFHVIGTKRFDCKHGPDRKKVFKSKLENAKNKVSYSHVKYCGDNMSKTGFAFCHTKFPNRSKPFLCERDF